MSGHETDNEGVELGVVNNWIQSGHSIGFSFVPDPSGYVAKVNIGSMLVLESGEVIDAIVNGTAEDVAVELAGMGGSLAGGAVLAPPFASGGFAVGGHLGAAVFGAMGAVLGAYLGEEAAEALLEELLSIRSPFVAWDGAPYDPFGDVVEELSEMYPNIPLPVLEAQALEALGVAVAIMRPPGATGVSVNTYLDQLHEPDGNNGGLHESLAAAEVYFNTVGHQLPPDPETPETGSSGGGSSSRPDDDDSDEDPDLVVAPVEPTTSVGAVGSPIPVVEPYHSVEHYENIGKGTVLTGLPIVLDLDGDGVEVAFGENIFFDMDDDGFREKTAWVAADDGFLVIDLNADGSHGAGDGVIDQSAELAFAASTEADDTDLEALAAYDLAINGGNGDGKLSSADPIWNELKVW